MNIVHFKDFVLSLFSNIFLLKCKVLMTEWKQMIRRPFTRMHHLRDDCPVKFLRMSKVRTVFSSRVIAQTVYRPRQFWNKSLKIQRAKAKLNI